MKFIELKKSLSDNLSPCYLVYGDDSFLCESSIELIEKQIFGSIIKNNLNKQVFSSEDIDAKKFVDTLNTMPFFSEKKLVIYKEYENKKNNEIISQLKDYLKAPNKSTVLIVISNKTNDLTKSLQSLFVVVECDKLDKILLVKWIENELKTSFNNSTITPEACELLIDFTNGYLSKISLEINKLVSLSNGTIKEEHIEEIVSKDLEYSIYEFTDNIINGNTKKAEIIKNDLLKNNKNQNIILGLISGYFRRLFYSITSEGTDKEIADMLSVKEYAVIKSKQIAKKFGAKKLKDILELCAELDYKTKTSQISLEHAIDYCLMYIYNLIK